MSSLIVEVCKVDKVERHPQADKLSIAHIKGWQTVIGYNPETGKNQFEEGDLCVFVPPDSILPAVLAERFNVAKYLSPVKNEDGTVVGGRVRVTRLRSIPSYGLIINVENPAWGLGQDLADHYGITKWEPPETCTDGDAEREYHAFHRYFTLENINNFPNLFIDGEEVVMTEKIHGKNARVGLIKEADECGDMQWTFMAGSHDVRRKEYQTQKKRKIDPATGEEVEYDVTKRSQFWEIFDIAGIKDLLIDMCDATHNVVVFGELYGSGVQDLAYGCANGEWDFRVFDITINGKYVDFDVIKMYCDKHNVKMVPTIYRGPFSNEKVQECVGGFTTMCDPDKAGKFKEREGIVIKTVKERCDANQKKFFDRAALKAINFKYLERKNGTEFH